MEVRRPGDAGAEGEAPPPTPLSARIELDTQTVPVGGTIGGQIVVTNTTGEALHVVACKTLFQVALANADYEQQPNWLLCAQQLTIPTGESSYPVTVRAEHLACIGAPPYRPGDIRCDDPFPTGDYEARLVQGYEGKHIPDPPTVHVRVVSAT
jgi:hypothetical protein